MATFGPQSLIHAGISSDTLLRDTLLLGDENETAIFDVTAAAGPFLRGEVVALIAATGFIAKLTAPPAAGDTLAVCSYDFTNTPAAVTAGNASSRASVYREGDFDETRLIFNGTATLANCRVALTQSGLNAQNPLRTN